MTGQCWGDIWLQLSEINFAGSNQTIFLNGYWNFSTPTRWQVYITFHVSRNVTRARLLHPIHDLVRISKVKCHKIKTQWSNPKTQFLFHRRTNCFGKRQLVLIGESRFISDKTLFLFILVSSSSHLLVPVGDEKGRNFNVESKCSFLFC